MGGGHHPTLDVQMAELQAKKKESTNGLYQKYGGVLAQSDHTPVYKKVGTGDAELSIMVWNVMEFPASKRPPERDAVIEGLVPFTDAVLKELKREEDRQLLLDTLSSDEIIELHTEQVCKMIQQGFEERDVDVILLQELGYSVQERIKDLCKGKSWYTCFSSGNSDDGKCDAITGIISNKDFQEEEGGGVEIQEGRTVRHFAAARRGTSWLVSCHVPLGSQEREGAKQEVGVKVIQKLVQELHGKGKSLVVGGDWNSDIKGVQLRVSSHMPYGVTACHAHTEMQTCFGTATPVDGILEIL